MFNQDYDFFLDSGAFSAWSKGKPVDLKAYCDFIEEHPEIKVYANLDVIAGQKGQKASPKEREVAAGKSWDNYLYMVEGRKLKPVPVFHTGEDPKWLHRMLDFGCDYIGLGGMVGIGKGKRREWLDSVFTEICDSEGYPTVKTHGFGVTDFDLMFRYPFHSVDSTSWQVYVRYGWVITPRTDIAGHLRFDTQPMIVSASTDPRAIAYAGKKHLLWQSQQVKDAMNLWLDMCGETMDRVANVLHARSRVAICFFQRVSEYKAEQPARFYAPRRRVSL